LPRSHLLRHQHPDRRSTLHRIERSPQATAESGGSKGECRGAASYGEKLVTA
jgi:hypothetical protein